MGLEFYTIETKEQLFQINDSEMKCFEEVFDTFNAKYNDLIDLYGDFKLYSNHLEFLKNAIEASQSKENVLLDFSTVINKCLLQNVTLIVKGD